MASTPKIASIILAGGVGSRLSPLTSTRCKPAVPFGGRYRIIDIAISNALASTTGRLYIISQFLANTLNRHIERTYCADPSINRRIDLLHPDRAGFSENSYKGTADAVRQNWSYLQHEEAEYFFILSGDQLYSMDLNHMLQFAIERKADLTVATIPIKETECSRLGVLKVNEEHHITDFAEKPQTTERIQQLASSVQTTGNKQHLGSMGIYLFHRDALFNLLQQDKREDFGKHLIPSKIKTKTTYAYPFDGYWEDIGTISTYHKAHLDLFYHRTGFNLYHSAIPLYTHPICLPSARLGKTHLNHAIVCDGSDVLAEEISYSLLGIGTEVGEGSHIHQSILLGSSPTNPSGRVHGCRVGKDCQLTNIIIDEGAEIGNNVHLSNRKGLDQYSSDALCVKDGIIIVKQGVKIPDHFTF